MTRKITFSVILILLLVLCYQVIFGNQTGIRNKVNGVKELRSASQKLDLAATQLDTQNSSAYETKRKELKEAIKNYNDAKEQYETLIPDDITAEEALSQYKDVYDVGFLWTIVGNYATEAGINLKFDVVKNVSSASSISNTSDEYVVCDLKFTVTGQYINLTDFIYSLENDDRLGFEINDFFMQKDGENLEVTLNVREIKVKAENLLETISTTTEDSSLMSDLKEGTQNQNKTQNVDSNTTKDQNTVDDDKVN